MVTAAPAASRSRLPGSCQVPAAAAQAQLDERGDEQHDAEHDAGGGSQASAAPGWRNRSGRCTDEQHRGGAGFTPVGRTPRRTSAARMRGRMSTTIMVGMSRHGDVAGSGWHLPSMAAASYSSAGMLCRPTSRMSV